MPIRQVNLELNLKSLPSVANLTRHKYIFSRVKSTSCALIRSDWFSGSMRRQLSLDPLSARAERCVTRERGQNWTISKKARPASGPPWAQKGKNSFSYKYPCMTFV